MFIFMSKRRQCLWWSMAWPWVPVVITETLKITRIKSESFNFKLQGGVGSPVIGCTSCASWSNDIMDSRCDCLFNSEKILICHLVTDTLHGSSDTHTTNMLWLLGLAINLFLHHVGFFFTEKLSVSVSLSWSAGQAALLRSGDEECDNKEVKGGISAHTRAHTTAAAACSSYGLDSFSTPAL